jgi:hypothetical protein
MIFAEFFALLMFFAAFTVGVVGFSKISAEKKAKRVEAQKAIRIALQTHDPEKVDEVIVFHGDYITDRERDYLTLRQADFTLDGEEERELKGKR